MPDGRARDAWEDLYGQGERPDKRLGTVTRHIRDLIQRHAAVSPCHDCRLPTSYAIGSYWLAPDDLWAQVVGDDTIVLCPGCFHDRAQAIGLVVAWRAEAVANTTNGERDE